MPAKESLGARIRRARLAARIRTQRELAQALGVATQTVTQWEQDTHAPARDRAVQIARVTGVSLSWLLTGLPLPVQSTDGRLVFIGNEGGNTVPLVAPDDVARDLDDELARTNLPRIPTVFACGPRAFAVIMPDRSGLPSYEPGDRLVFDPDRRVEPGDLVLAAVGAERTALIGRLSYETSPHGRVTVIAPVNPLYAPARSDHGPIQIRGSLSEFTRQTR